MMDVNVRINGGDDYWQIILNFDRGGPWVIDEIAAESQVNKETIKAFVQRLVKGGYASPVFNALGMPLGYSLAKRLPVKPRLKADGSELPETMLETMWRSMRMAKTFTAQSLADFGSQRDTKISLETARRYLRDLSDCGIIAPLGGWTFRLVRDLGPRAPRILHAHIVYDPNSLSVIGEPVAREVQS